MSERCYIERDPVFGNLIFTEFRKTLENSGLLAETWKKCKKISYSLNFFILGTREALCLFSNL